VDLGRRVNENGDVIEQGIRNQISFVEINEEHDPFKEAQLVDFGE
jgi:hypothetical protein